MFGWLYHWWSEQSPWLRYGVAIVLLAISTVLYFGFDRIWVWGWIVGTVFLLMAAPSDLEKKGYFD